ncbi:MAG: DUF4367 domain-containing protein [Lachnospiraceae bacterium]|nr:DUF4367 domain-containing protein [Lachnospiraceae bacterium]
MCLVQLLDLEKPANDQEIEDSKKKFESNFQQANQTTIRRNRLLRHGNRLAGICMALLLIFLAADVTTKAVMNESLFHMVSRWKGQVEIIPGEKSIEEESSDFGESETQYFKSIKEFSRNFQNDFLVCSWLPENVSLNKIAIRKGDKFSEIVWEYNNTNLKDWKMQIWMCRNTEKDTAGFSSNLENDIFSEETINGMKVTYYVRDEGALAGFEYQDFWYLVDIKEDKEILKHIIESMVEYEK